MKRSEKVAKCCAAAHWFARFGWLGQADFHHLVKVAKFYENGIPDTKDATQEIAT